MLTQKKTSTVRLDFSWQSNAQVSVVWTFQAIVELFVYLINCGFVFVLVNRFHELNSTTDKVFVHSQRKAVHISILLKYSLCEQSCVPQSNVFSYPIGSGQPSQREMKETRRREQNNNTKLRGGGGQRKILKTHMTSWLPRSSNLNVGTMTSTSQQQNGKKAFHLPSAENLWVTSSSIIACDEEKNKWSVKATHSHMWRWWWKEGEGVQGGRGPRVGGGVFHNDNRDDVTSFGGYFIQHRLSDSRHLIPTFTTGLWVLFTSLPLKKARSSIGAGPLMLPPPPLACHTQGKCHPTRKMPSPSGLSPSPFWLVTSLWHPPPPIAVHSDATVAAKYLGLCGQISGLFIAAEFTEKRTLASFRVPNKRPIILRVFLCERKR